MSKEQIKKVFSKVVESGGKKAVSKAMREVGYPDTTAKNPQKITRSKTWDKLVEQRLSDDKLTGVHSELLNATRIDHMVFPLGPKEYSEDEDSDEDEEGEQLLQAEHTSLTDQEIKDMLKEVNCKVRRIVHGQTARHVYFWAADNKARKEALDMAYKLKDKYPQRPGSNVVVPVQINFNDEKEEYK